MDENLAEFVGVLLGDGSIGVYDCKANGKIKKQYRVKITLNSEDDAEYALYLEKQIFHLFCVKPLLRKRKGEKAIDLLIFNKRIVNFLLDMGMEKAPKWNRATVPNKFLHPTHAPSLLRGYVDTDGCVTIANNNGTRYPRIEMKICPSPMQNQLVSALVILGFKPRIHAIGKGKVRVVLAGLGNLKKWMKVVGFSNPKNIRRAESFLKNRIDIRKIAGDGLPTQTRISGPNF